MKATHWRRKDGGWIRSDGKYRIHRSPSLLSSRQSKFYVEVSQGDKWFVVKDKIGRNTRTWGEYENTRAAIDKEFPMSDISEGSWEYQNNSTWKRKDNEFVVQRMATNSSLVSEKYIARWNAGGTDDNWTTMKTKNGRNIRAWESAENAMAAIDKEFPMKKQDESSNTEKESPEKTRVNMNFIFDGGPAEATRVISMFLSGKNITNLDLKVEGYDPRPTIGLRRDR